APRGNPGAAARARRDADCRRGAGSDTAGCRYGWRAAGESVACGATHDDRSCSMIVVVMGVTGSGKTVVGSALAKELDWPFLDGDDFHPPANVAKMASGTPLVDADRWPWLDRLADEMGAILARGGSAVLACSALKQAYRDRLSASARAP